MRALRREDIYDCLDDDAAFARLPGLVAGLIGARSAVFHWRSTSDTPLVLADSGYWSPAQMGDYVDLYAEHDIWAQSTLTRHTQNRLWVIDDLVPDRIYGKSIFYNEWIKAMGDDTFHCAGMSLAGRSGTGLIGLHRAKTSGAFEEGDLAVLAEQIAPLQRLMRVRAMLAEAREGQALLGDAFDRLALDVFIVGRDLRLLHANGSADRLLVAGTPFAIRGGRIEAADRRDVSALTAAVASATSATSPETSFVEIGGAGGARVMLTVAPISHGGRRCAMLMLKPASPPNAARQLQQVFGLTASEAAVAAALAQGRSPAEIATARETSVLTVRTQLKSITAKMGCHRQSEVVATIARLRPI